MAGHTARIAVATAAAPALAFAPDGANARTCGVATLPPGTLSHAIASAISKALKDQASTDVLVQAAAGGNIKFHNECNLLPRPIG